MPDLIYAHSMSPRKPFRPLSMNRPALSSNFLVLLLGFSVLLSTAGCNKTSKAKKTWNLATEGVFSATFSKRHVLMGSTTGKAVLWELGNKNVLHTWQHGKDANGGIVAVDIAGNDEYAITAERDSLAWWRIKDGKLMGSWGFPFIKSVSLSKDGRFALIGMSDQALYFALQYGKTIYSFDHQGPVGATALSADGNFALTGSDDTTAKLWDLANGKLRHTWKHRTKIASVALSTRSRFAATSEALGETRIWSPKKGKLIRSIGPKVMTISSAAFSPNEKYLATGRTSQRIDLWLIKSGKAMKSWYPKKAANWRPSASTILALGFTGKGKALLSAASNGYAQMWRIR